MKWLSRLSLILLVVRMGGGAYAAPAVTNLTENRILLFNDYASSNTAVLVNQPWTLHEGPTYGLLNATKAALPGTNHFHRAGWRLISCRSGTVGAQSGARIIPPVVPVPTYPLIASNLAANLRNDANAAVESPVLTNGVGTVYFEAINALSGAPTELSVDLATNMWDTVGETNVYTLLPPVTNHLQYVWQTVGVTNLNAATTNDFSRYAQALLVRVPAKVRVRRSGSLYAATQDSNFTVVDNVRLSPPPTDVRVYDASAFNQAGNYTIRCFVDNVDSSVPTDSRTVTAYYRWLNLGTPWTNSAMALVAGTPNGSGSQYELVLPPQILGGELEYYVVCDFSGFVYQSPDYTGLNYAGYASEALSPFTTGVQTQQLAGADLYTLTVVGGSGGGTYTNGQAVAISASNLVGRTFDRWTGATQYVSNVTSQTATVTMPESDITVTATYTDNIYTLTVTDGSGSGSYPYGQVVPVSADVLAGKVFVRWTGDTQYLSDAFAASTTVTIPDANVAVTALYANAYTLTVTDGSGSGSYTNGQQAAIAANPPPPGKIFLRWSGSTSHVADAAAANTVVTMPAFDIALTATYIDVHTLTVTSGTGGGSYTNGHVVALSANAPPGGKIFSRWTGDTAYVANVTAPNTTLTMPNVDVAVTATYVDVYVLTVNSGTGGGSYTNGQSVTLTANAPVAGQVFAMWTGATQYVADAFAPLTTLTMPASAIAVTATYSNLIYTLTVSGGTGSGAYTNGQVVAISASVPVDKTFDRWSGDTPYVGNVTSANTTVTMPALNIAVSALYSSQTSVLPESRFLHFNDYAQSNTTVLLNQPWTLHEGPLVPGIVNPPRALLPGTNHLHRTGWRLFSCRTGTVGGYSGARYIPPIVTVPNYPAIASNLAANLRNDLGSRIESPVFTNGVGTIYFEAVNGSVDYPTELTVEIATNMFDTIQGTNVLTVLPPSTNGLEYIWQPISVVSLAAPTANDFVRYNVRLNARVPAVLRISRTGTIYPALSQDAAYTVLDNLRVSPPPSDVLLAKTAAPFEPGYPAVATNIEVRCLVSNADMTVPTDSRTPKVVYRWRFLNQSVQAWRTNAMVYVAGSGDGQGNGELYRASLSAAPFTDVGDLEYYFTCDFGGYVYLPPDYTGMNYTGYPSENLSPRLYRNNADGSEFAVRLREYASRYSKLYVVGETNQYANPIEMVLSGHNEWRGMVPIAGTGYSNLVWRFKGEGEYQDGSGVVSTNVKYWAGVSGAPGGRVPFGGFCAETNETGRLSVLVDEGNYVLLTLNTETLQYSATRGEYQNFNSWPAPANAFSESNGQDPKHSYMNTFEDWPANQFVSYLQAFSGYPTSTNVFVRDPFYTIAPEFVAGSAAYISERTLGDNTVNAPTNVPKFRNVALRLKGGDGTLGLGYIYNRVATLPDGLKDVTFKARLSQSADNYDVAYYRNGFTNFNYYVRATARAVSSIGLSPHNPSVSLVGYYRDADNFYEYRVVQTNDAADTAGSITDRTIRHELYRWRNGTPTLLTMSPIQTTSSSPLLNPSIGDSAPLEIGFYTVSGSSVQIRCRYANADKISYTDNSSPHTSGTFGYMAADCWSQLSNVRTIGTVAGPTVSGSTELVVLRQDTTANFDADVANWFMPAGKYVARNDVTPKGIYSVVPSQPIGVYVQPTEFGTDQEPDAVGSLNWKLARTVSVTNFSYQSVTVPFNSWQSQFVMLQVQGGGLDVAVDEINVSSWHGQRNGLGWADPFEWVAYESWVATNGAFGNTLYLEHSRGNPLEDQTVRSLLLETGMGLMEFDYQVLRGPAKLTVEYAPQFDETDWREVESFVVSNTVGWTHASAYLGTNAPGYFRLINTREGIFTNAWIEVDNVTVWDEPTITNNSWRAYNVKITSTDTNRVALDESQACFLNNSKTQEASPPQTEFEPYLRSPELPKGLGKLSFYARAYTNNQAATLYVYASTNGWNAPTNQWFELTRFENITNGLYRLFTYEPQDGRKIDAIQLGTLTRSSDRRVCVEDVTITEPVFPGFEITSVQLMEIPSGEDYASYPQPLEGQEVHVQARIDNIQMAPSNIVMYMSYFVGSNGWGIGNWPSGEIVTRRMTNNVPGDPTLYRTVPTGTAGFPASLTGGIEGQNRDEVVQYYVWAEYDGGLPLRAQQETFENPDWYYPINLNERYAQQGWSPYYFVYGVPLNAVWINEVNATDYVEVNGVQQRGIWDNAYIEIAMPVWMDLAGWTIELVTTGDYQVRPITIPAGLPEQVAATNGYAFFVIGDAAPRDPGVPALPKVDYEYPDLKANMPRILPGGLRLKRPMGMYEQASAYDWTNDWGGVYSGSSWASNDPQKRFKYVGQENNGGSLGVTNGNGTTFSDWVFPMTWTPGSANNGQVVPNGDALVPGVSNVLITSLMNLDKATQNGKRLTYYTLKMRKGMSTNIVYRTDPWYRLFSVQQNAVEQLPSIGTETNFTLNLPDLQADVAVNVDVRLREDLSSQGLDPDVLNWVLSFQDGELIPMYYNNRILTLTDQYWINAPPTQSNTFELAITKVTVDPSTNFHVTVKMALNGNKLSAFQGQAVLQLQAKSSLLDPEWTMLSQYSLTAASFDASNTCRVFVPNPFALVLAGVDPETLFFRWLIELNDPRVSIQVLTNVPE